MASARHIPTADTSNMMENGNAVMMVILCSALNPPATSSTAARTPSRMAQKARCSGGVLERPPDASESITSDAESEDVTKKMTISKMVMLEIMDVKGSRSNNLNSAMALSFCTSVIRAVYPSFNIMYSAVSPKTENQKNV